MYLLIFPDWNSSGVKVVLLLLLVNNDGPSSTRLTTATPLKSNDEDDKYVRRMVSQRNVVISRSRRSNIHGLPIVE